MAFEEYQKEVEEEEKKKKEEEKKKEKEEKSRQALGALIADNGDDFF